MEYVEGSTLAALIAREDHAIDADRLAAELLDALRQIHGAGVVHRDVKPANILVDGAGMAKLTDFGIARPADATQLTQTGQVIGTLAYMAPEVKEGHEADQRSDLYSLGVVLRECAKRGASAALISLTERLTAAAPPDRPPSAEAALGLLAPGDPAATAEPTVPLAAPGPRRRRMPAAVLLAMAAVAAVILLVALDSGDSGSKSGGNKAATTGPKETSTEQAQQPTTPSPTQPANPPPQPTQEAQPPPPSPLRCDQLEERKHALEEQKKEAQEEAGDDKDAKKRIDEAFAAREEQLKQRDEACKAAEKATEEGDGHAPPGHEKSGGEPPGKAKKEKD
jgi:serine/threonine protein kinase